MLEGADSGYRFRMATPVFQHSRIILIGPTPTIIQGITPIALIWSGVVIRDIDITTIINIGIITDQGITTKGTIMVTNETINEVTKAAVIGNTIGKIIIDSNGCDKFPSKRNRVSGNRRRPFFLLNPSFLFYTTSTCWKVSSSILWFQFSRFS